MGYKLKPDGLRFPKDERVLIISINKNDEVQFIITHTNYILSRFRMYEQIDGEFMLLWGTRTADELLEKLYYEKGLALK